MATEQELHQLVGRAVVDKAFRARLAADPVAAAAEAGVTLTAEEAAGLRSEDGQGVAQVLEERLPKVRGLWYCWTNGVSAVPGGA